jgi:hypothetical protein
MSLRIIPTLWITSFIFLASAGTPGVAGPLDGAGAGRSTTTAKPVGRSVTFKAASLMDRPEMIGGEVFRLLIPSDWRLEGGVVWRMNPANPASFRMRAIDPKGLAEVGLMPDIPCIWDPSIATYFPVGSSYLGAEVRPPIMDPAQCLRSMILPRYWPDLQNAAIVTQQELPDLAAQGPQMFPEAVGARFRAGKVRLQYGSRGASIEQDVYCLIGAVQLPGNFSRPVAWGPGEIRYSRAEKGALDDQYKIFQTIACSMRQNLHWFNRYQQLVQMLVQNQIASSNRLVDLSRYISHTNDQISASIRRSYENRQAAMDRINQRFDNHIRGVEDYQNPYSGSTVQLPSGYGEAWVNGSGEYLLSDNPNFNPNVGTNREWRRMPKPN